MSNTMIEATEKYFYQLLGESNAYAIFIVQVCLILLITYIICHIGNVFLKKLEKVLIVKSKSYLTYTLYAKLLGLARKPILILFCITVFCIVLEIAFNRIHCPLVWFLDISQLLSIITLISWVLIKFLNDLELELLSRASRPKARLDKSMVDIIMKLAKAVIYTTTILLIIQGLGYSLNGILAFGGLSGIAIGFAAKDLLSNFFGTIIIYFDKPFVVGECIKMIDSGKVGLEGKVEKVDWRVTTVRTIDRKMLYIPNSLFSTVAIENTSRISHLRIVENIEIRLLYSTVVANLIHDIREILVHHESIDKTQDIIINISSIIRDVIKLEVQCFTTVLCMEAFYELRKDILLKILAVIEKLQLSI